MCFDERERDGLVQEQRGSKTLRVCVFVCVYSHSVDDLLFLSIQTLIV